MRNLTLLATAAFLTAALLAPANAQPPQKGGDNPAKSKDYSASSIVTKMMAFNKKGDGKLTRDEVTDSRLLRLFDEADTNKDGVVTKEELMALAAKLDLQDGQGGRGGPGGPGGGPGGPGGGPGGPGGPGGRGRGGMPQPGQIMPVFLQDMLNLTAEQKKKFEDLQKKVDEEMAKILTDEQKQQLKEMQNGPGGRGPGGPPKKDN